MKRENENRLILLTVIIVVVVLVVGIVVLVPLNIKVLEVIKSDNYTKGDTDLKQFDPNYCKAVKMTLGGSNESTASLHLLNTLPQLSYRDVLVATLDGPLQPKEYFSNWSFHIHPGSNMTMKYCVMSLDLTCKQRDEVWFRIIRGEKNFSLWRGNQGNNNYAVKSFELPVSFDECHTPLTLQYHYEEEGDYYHVFRNFGNCKIRISANITINRTQYDYIPKESVGNCEVLNPTDTCSVSVKTTDSPYYALIIVDQIRKVIEWKTDIHVTLICIPRDWLAGLDAGIVLLIIAVLTVSITVWAIYCSRYRRGYGRLRRGTGAAIQ